MNWLYCTFVTAAALVGVVSTDQIEAWAKLTAVPILGALLVGFGFLHWRTVNRLAGEISKQNEFNNQLLKQVIEGNGTPTE